jgi:stage V sporulation protein R
MFRKASTAKNGDKLDVMEYILRFSPFLKQEENEWIKSVMQTTGKNKNYERGMGKLLA